MERVHRYLGASLRIALGKSNAIHDNWDEVLPYIVFSYNKKFIPGTTISPFMMRNGFAPAYPEDLAMKELVFQSKTYQEKLQEVSERYELAERLVREAHEESKAAQKLQYDAGHYDVEFGIGSLVLWYCDDQVDKLCFKWHGPYKVVERKSPVKYVIEDMLDDKRQEVSVQQIVPFFGEYADPPDDDGDVPVDQTVQRQQLKSLEFRKLKKGRFVVFQRKDTIKAHGHRAIHIGEVTKEYNPVSGQVEIFHYIDLGPNDNLRSYSVTKPIEKRRSFPEYYDEKGNSYTRKRCTTPVRPNSSEYKEDYTADRIVIIAKDWFMQKGGKVPSDVCLKVNAFLDNYKTP